MAVSRLRNSFRDNFVEAGSLRHLGAYSRIELLSQTLLGILMSENYNSQNEDLKVNIDVRLSATSDELILHTSTRVHGRYLCISKVISVQEYISRSEQGREYLFECRIKNALHRLLSAALTPMTLAQWASDGSPVEYWVLDQALENGHLTPSEYLGIRGT